MLDRLQFHDFEPLRGSDFTVEFPNGARLPMRLREIERLAESKAPGARPRPFSLLFAGPADEPLEQGTYAFRHERLSAPLGIFIVPLGVRDGAMLYEAVFA